MDDKTRKALIRLAYNRPELREELLPLINSQEPKTAAGEPAQRSLQAALSVTASIDVIALSAVPDDDRRFQATGKLVIFDGERDLGSTHFAGVIEIDSAGVAFQPEDDMAPLYLRALQAALEERHDDVFQMTMAL